MFSTWLWCNSQPRIADTMKVSSRSSLQSPKLLLDAAVILLRCCIADTNVTKAVVASRLQGQMRSVRSGLCSVLAFLRTSTVAHARTKKAS